MKTIAFFSVLSTVFLILTPLTVSAKVVDKKLNVHIEQIKVIKSEPSLPKIIPVETAKPVVQEIVKVDFLVSTLKETKIVPAKKILKNTKVKKIIEVKQDYTSSQEEVIEIIKHYSMVYGLDEARVLRIAKCESGYNSNALSSSGKFKGLFQFDSSFYGWAKKLEIENPDPFNPEHNTRAATLAMSYGLWSKWPSCSKI